MSKPIVPTEQLETVIRRLPDAFTILDFADVFREAYPDVWEGLVERYGLYGSGTRYSALTYLSNRISAYARRKAPALLEPTPKGWKPEEGRYLRRSTKKERERFGSISEAAGSSSTGGGEPFRRMMPGIYAYDAYLIRCGLKYTAPLISLDQGLVEAARRMGVNVVEVGR
jgi:hypothetical protein